MEKQDRRVIRSKMRMREALISLMQEKLFPEITARDITDRADLNRATFYLHYNNVFDLLEELEEETVSEFARMLEETPILENSTWESVLIGKICDYIAENQDLCRCLFLNPHSDCFTEKLTEIMKRKGQEIRKERGLERDSRQDGLYPPFYFLWCHGDGKAVACGGDAALQGRNDGFNGKNHAPHFSIIVCGLNLRLQKKALSL